VNSETFGYALIIALLLGVAGYFAWKQVATLRGLRAVAEPLGDEQIYLRKQAVRRLIGCGLMTLLAGMMIASYFAGLEAWGTALENAAAAPGEKLENRELDQQRRSFLSFYASFYIGVLLIVLLLLFIAALDFWAIQRYHLSQYRRIQAERKELVQEQAARFRHQRNGQH